MQLLHLVTIAALVVGCSKKSETSSDPSKPLAAEEVFARKDALKGKRVTVTGVVKRVTNMGGYTVLLAAGDKVIDLEFSDPAVAEKGIKEGDRVTAECKIDHPSVDGNDLLTSSCALR